MRGCFGEVMVAVVGKRLIMTLVDAGWLWVKVSSEVEIGNASGDLED